MLKKMLISRIEIKNYVFEIFLILSNILGCVLKLGWME